jgi:hypothetical protein
MKTISVLSVRSFSFIVSFRPHRHSRRRCRCTRKGQEKDIIFRLSFGVKKTMKEIVGRNQ